MPNKIVTFSEKVTFGTFRRKVSKWYFSEKIQVALFGNCLSPCRYILKFKRITIFCISQIASTETTTRIIKWLEPNNEVVFGLQPTINWVKPNSIHISYGISQNIVSIFYKLVDLKVINSIVPCQCSVYRCQSSLIVKKLNKIPKFN